MHNSIEFISYSEWPYARSKKKGGSNSKNWSNAVIIDHEDYNAYRSCSDDYWRETIAPTKNLEQNFEWKKHHIKYTVGGVDCSDG